MSMEDSEIRELLSRLARPHASGGQVVERATILAAGAEFQVILEWIVAHAGQPEAESTAAAAGGLHSERMRNGPRPAGRAPQRYVLPADALA
jgi:hypothetical protein